MEQTSKETAKVQKEFKPTILDDQTFTLDEYRLALAQPIDFPDPTNPHDPRYYQKHAHNIPPLEAHLVLPNKWEIFNTE